MKITLEKNGSVTVKFDGTLGVRQAISMNKVIGLFPNRTRMTLDFTDVQWESELAALSVVPSIASTHRANVQVAGLELERPRRHLRLAA